MSKPIRVDTGRIRIIRQTLVTFYTVNSVYTDIVLWIHCYKFELFSQRFQNAHRYYSDTKQNNLIYIPAQLL